MKNINELIFRVNDNLRNNLEVDKQDVKQLLNIAMEMEKQLSISRVSKSLPSNDLANWTLRNGWVYNFCDGKWWQLQESHNYIKKTTKEIANMIEGNVC